MIVNLVGERNQLTQYCKALSITEHPTFHDLLQYQRPKTKETDIPHRTKLTETVCSRAVEIEAKLAQELRNAPGRISLTFDGWTSKIMTAYLAVTSHYIDEDWELHADLLSFEELDGSHTGENIAEVLYNIVDKAGIKEKVSYLFCFFEFVTINTPLAAKRDIRQCVDK